jgi:hypothetical protein
MKYAAYICLGDPAWIEASVQSYYPYVSKIIATYDRDGLSWTGPKIDINVCIERLKAIDVEKKVEFVADKFSIPSNYGNPILNDTMQRQVGVDLASQYGDWVLQLDTDEIIANWKVFVAQLKFANANEFDAVYFPSIYVYQLISRTIALESCRRWGVRQAGYPGPLCVRAGTELYLSRRSRGRTLHVRCQGAFDTVIEHDAVVSDTRVAEGDCVVHITRGRTPEYMKKKFETWGHSKDRSYALDLKYWKIVRRFPWLLLLSSHLVRGNQLDKFRLFRMPKSVAALIHNTTLDGDVMLNSTNSEC